MKIDLDSIRDKGYQVEVIEEDGREVVAISGTKAPTTDTREALNLLAYSLGIRGEKGKERLLEACLHSQQQVVLESSILR